MNLPIFGDAEPDTSAGWLRSVGPGLARQLFVPLAVAWLGFFACVRPLATPDEGRYTHIARWMTLSGDWLIPRTTACPSCTSRRCTTGWKRS